MTSYDLTATEEALINSYILLPLTYRVLERDLRLLEMSKVKFKHPYYTLIEKALKQLAKDLHVTKAEVFKQKIKLYKKDDLHYDIWIRGWHHQKGYHPKLAAHWVEAKVTEYLNAKTHCL
ncbi:hypothetical protein GCM10011391_32930 [Pullulanibacillus camelliae]|uniref:Uncharacterized protein n=1 Tax=Pullulanibacillus camelliae TaxID=1707096 RepID=A0A8J2YLS2_9BACL|nr:hypothetical protein [Pullulanibacillus camelliae]GGE51534.1 hypothetical protein GCM10011391_32930 [Pullulanibacillus camelliae]